MTSLFRDDGRRGRGSSSRVVLNMWMTIDEALKRVRSHADVLGAGVATANGELIRAAGDFDARAARRAVRLVAVAAHAVEDASDEEGCDSPSRSMETVRARRGDRELIVTRCGGVVLAVSTR